MLTETRVILIHDHPGFSTELKSLVHQWNQLQSAFTFMIVPFPAASDRHLLSAGSIKTDTALRHAMKAREAFGQSRHSYLFTFTERRLTEPPLYYQMYSINWNHGGNERDRRCREVALIAHRRRP